MAQGSFGCILPKRAEPYTKIVEELPQIRGEAVQLGAAGGRRCTCSVSDSEQCPDFLRGPRREPHNLKADIFKYL